MRIIETQSIYKTPQAIALRYAELEERRLTALSSVDSGYKDEVLARLEQGRLLSLAESFVGLKEISSLIAVPYHTLYHIKRVFEHFGSIVAFLRQSEIWEEEGRRITWSMLKNHVYKRSETDIEVEYERQKKNLKRATKKLEERASDFKAFAKAMRDEEGEDLAGLTFQAIEDAQREDREEIDDKDKTYLSYIRTLPCSLCGREKVDAHHIETGGMGMKGRDHFTIPLCRKCHTESHQKGKVWLDSAFLSASAWAEVAENLSNYLNEIRRLTNEATHNKNGR